MERRGFLKLFGAGLAGIALGDAIPFGRVWSFPKNIIIPKPATLLLITEWISHESLRLLQNSIDYSAWEHRFDEALARGVEWNRKLKVGEIISIRSVNRINA
jgi:hypothetical protein